MSGELRYVRCRAARDLRGLKIREGQTVETDGRSIRIDGRVYGGLEALKAICSGAFVPLDAP
ncbi:MAG: hypothetical protein KF764_31495 [Labilithrix sp.]|nr:hypothetical protein [Labilithrix sp.]